MNQAEDVEIVLGYERHYKFHSGTLARNSPLFADMLTELNAAHLSSRARNAGIKIRWMIELTCLPCDKYPAGRFELIVSLLFPTPKSLIIHWPTPRNSQRPASGLIIARVSLSTRMDLFRKRRSIPPLFA